MSIATHRMGALKKNKSRETDYSNEAHCKLLSTGDQCMCNSLAGVASCLTSYVAGRSVMAELGACDVAWVLARRVLLLPCHQRHRATPNLTSSGDTIGGTPATSPSAVIANVATRTCPFSSGSSTGCEPLMHFNKSYVVGATFFKKLLTKTSILLNIYKLNVYLLVK